MSVIKPCDTSIPWQSVMAGMDVSLGSMPAMTSSLLLLSILKLQVQVQMKCKLI
jgi:hypothetical protein